jgi:hypothetical protein
MTDPIRPTGAGGGRGDERSDEGDGQTGATRPSDTPPSTPRWVRVFGVIAAGLVLLFVVVHLAGGGFRNHAP